MRKLGKLDLKKFFYDKPQKNALILGVEFLLIGVYLAIDLLTKQFVYGPIAAGGPDIIIIEGVIRFTAVRNTGASFGIFSNATAALLAISIITAVVLSVIWIFTVKERNGWLRAAFILMIAGAVGNIVDRIAFGYVRDFVYFELIDFAVFNLADSGLCVGCALMIIYIIFFYRPENKSENKEIVVETSIKSQENIESIIPAQDDVADENFDRLGLDKDNAENNSDDSEVI